MAAEEDEFVSVAVSDGAEMVVDQYPTYRIYHRDKWNNYPLNFPVSRYGGPPASNNRRNRIERLPRWPFLFRLTLGGLWLSRGLQRS